MGTQNPPKSSFLSRITHPKYGRYPALAGILLIFPSFVKKVLDVAEGHSPLSTTLKEGGLIIVLGLGVAYSFTSDNVHVHQVLSKMWVGVLVSAFTLLYALVFIPVPENYVLLCVCVLIWVALYVQRRRNKGRGQG